MPRHFPPTSLRRENMVSSAATSANTASPAGDAAHRHHLPRNNDPQRDLLSRHQRMKNHLIAVVGEYVGTTLFLWFAFAGTQACATTGGGAGNNPSQIVLTSLAFGFSLLVTVWAFYRISGGLFNPAVTLGLVITNNLPWFRGLLLLPAQLLGGMTAAGLVKCMFPGPLIVSTTLGNGTTPAQGVFIEMFLTSLLVFTILMLAAEKHYATFMAPVGIGLALFVAMMAGLPFTGSSLNPARSFGPAVAIPYFPGYHYIYWFGPIMGALLAGGYYRFVKYFKYEEANPGQDAVSPEEMQREKSRDEEMG
ncbi:Aquaporin-1 [Cladophialophora carrionii]|uniref:Aquaporin-1 n=1 Tax=Cladophialophora carrionii TaxID=86049 RepID=A0A1C1CJD5_9EURO|nr:Aquaporin-1 [Cladophialophora carrionii]